MRPLSRSLFAALVLASSCAARRPQLKAPALVVEAQETGVSDRLQAIRLLEESLSGTPDPALLPWAMLHAGEQRRLSGDTAVARQWFERVAADHPTHPLKNAAVLGLALVDASVSVSGNTAATLQLAGDLGVPASMNADRHRLLARLGADEGSNPARVRDSVRKAVAYSQGDPTVESRVRYTLSDLLEGEQRASLAELPKDAASAESDALADARSALANNQLTEADRLASTFLSVYPDSDKADDARYIVRLAEAGNRVEAGKVGVLLPLTGTYGAVGKGLKQVIELANDRDGNRLNLTFVDASGDAEAVVSQIEQLVIEDGAVALLGPLLKEQVEPAAAVAQKLGAPMVALSQSGAPTNAGDFVFQGFLPLGQQVDALLDHAVTSEGWSRFAILHPDTSYGLTVRDLFAEGAKERGAEVVRIEEYDDEATEFLKDAQALGQKDYEARANEFWRLKKEAKQRGRDASKVVLPPVVDFDAIFIPDNYRRASLVAASLAYEEFSVGDFRTNRYAETVPLLGLNGWNHPGIIEAGGQYVQDAVFVDAFLADPNDMAVETFLRDYRQALGRTPSVIDALAWDTTRLLQTAVTAGGPDREAVRSELSEVVIRDAVSGGTRFDEDRKVARKLLVLTIDGNRIRTWTPPDPEPEPVPEGPQ